MLAAVACLTMAIYFEARSEPVIGQYAVAEVVLNRVYDPRFPDTVCEVIAEDRGPGDHDCQFSFYCDGRPEIFHNKKAHKQARAIAIAVLDDPTDVTRGALYYHAEWVSPAWSRQLHPVVMVGSHIFYADRKEIL